jgi:CRP-like cAMP-binding protein
VSEFVEILIERGCDLTWRSIRNRKPDAVGGDEVMNDITAHKAIERNAYAYSIRSPEETSHANDLGIARQYRLVPARFQHSPGNRLLAALSSEEYERILPGLENVSFSLGEVIYEFSERLEYAYFPATSIVSMVYIMEDGAAAEMGIVGNEGLVGVALFLGGETRPNRAIVQHPGGAIKMKFKTLQEEFKRAGTFQLLLLRYTQALITQLSQKAVCNRLHSVEQRLACWVLLTLDRVGSDELEVTQEFVSNLLGVRREGVTLTAGWFREKGLISWRRRHMTVLDRAGLEAVACECYRVVKDEYDRLLGH